MQVRTDLVVAGPAMTSFIDQVRKETVATTTSDGNGIRSYVMNEMQGLLSRLAYGSSTCRAACFLPPSRGGARQGSAGRCRVVPQPPAKRWPCRHPATAFSLQQNQQTATTEKGTDVSHHSRLTFLPTIETVIKKKKGFCRQLNHTRFVSPPPLLPSFLLVLQ